MNTKLFKTSIVVGLLVVASFSAWYLVNQAEEKEAKLTLAVYGDWVAAEGFCNSNMTGITGLDLNETSLFKNGIRVPIEHIQIDEQNTSPDRCEQGLITYDFEFTLLPLNETYLHGAMADFPVIKSASQGIVYFKMSPEFKTAYELFSQKPQQ